MFMRSLKKCVDWGKIDKNNYLNAMRKVVCNSAYGTKRTLIGTFSTLFVPYFQIKTLYLFRIKGNAYDDTGRNTPIFTLQPIFEQG